MDSDPLAQLAQLLAGAGPFAGPVLLIAWLELRVLPRVREMWSLTHSIARKVGAEIPEHTQGVKP